jgi:hypothetical protein
MSKPTETLLAGPIPIREEVVELPSQNGQPDQVVKPVEEARVPAHPAPIAPVDFEHVHRKLMRLLVSLEQTGAISSDEVHRIRAHP